MTFLKGRTPTCGKRGCYTVTSVGGSCVPRVPLPESQMSLRLRPPGLATTHWLQPLGAEQITGQSIDQAETQFLYLPNRASGKGAREKSTRQFGENPAGRLVHSRCSINVSSSCDAVCYYSHWSHVILVHLSSKWPFVAQGISSLFGGLIPGNQQKRRPISRHGSEQDWGLILIDHSTTSPTSTHRTHPDILLVALLTNSGRAQFDFGFSRILWRTDRS